MGGASARYGGVAQLGERTVRIRKVKGSIPSVSTTNENPVDDKSAGFFRFVLFIFHYSIFIIH